MPAWGVTARDQFEASLDNDLNIAEALAAIFEMVHAGNRALDAGELSGWSAASVAGLMAAFDTVLAVLEGGVAPDAPDAALAAMLAERAAARAARDWAASDRIRDALNVEGWEVRDTPEGQKIKRLQGAAVL